MLRSRQILAPASAAVMLAGALALPSAVRAESLTGRWQATAEVGGAQIPFRLDLVRSGEAVTGAFFDASWYL